MPQSISIPPLIPLPHESGAQSPAHDDKEDIFATLFSPATPRASPTPGSGPEKLFRPARHSRSASVDSEFGSFVSVPSSEDPLHTADQDFSPVPFTPLQNFDFFDRFTEDAKVATERNKKEVLDELLQSEADPTAFLRDGPRSSHGLDQAIASRLASSRPESRVSTHSNLSQTSSQSINTLHNKPLVPLHGTEIAFPSHSPPKPPSDLLDELLEHEDDPLYFTQPAVSAESRASTSTGDSSLLDLDPTDDDQLERTSRHPTRRSNWTESVIGTSMLSEPSRSPSLPPAPVRISTPEVQRTQSVFTPSSLVSSSFSSRWMSSLLSRPAPAPAPVQPEPDYAAPVSHGRAATIAGSSITHGTPFAAHPYIPPSGAPGFAGDRTWDKGFQFDREGVERRSLQLVGRKEVTIGILTTSLADQLRPYLPALKRLPRSWSLLYSLDQHGISLNTLYTKCESHTGGALVVMQDSNGAVFGAWMSEGIRLSKGAYYGSGESFLWKTTSDQTVRVFKWTGKNDYVALCEPDYVSFGGGDGHYGLYLDDTLNDGSSARCPTFENEPLCSAGPRQGEAITFECVGLEVWGVG